MIKKMSERFVNWQIKRNLLDEKESAVYQYAYELLINQIFNILIAIIIAIVWHTPVTVFFFLVSYIPLRSFCGGYHAKTNGGCMVVSAILLNIVCVIVKLVPTIWLIWVQPVMLAVAGIIIVICAPVEDQNKRLDHVEIERYKRNSRIIWAVEVILAMIVTFALKIEKAGFSVTIAHVIMAIMLCLGMMKNRKNRKRS